MLSGTLAELVVRVLTTENLNATTRFHDDEMDLSEAFVAFFIV